MSFWMTQSLLSSWLYYVSAEDGQTETALKEFLSTLRREKVERTKAMSDGIRFEALVNSFATAGEPVKEIIPNEKWRKAAQRFARLCADGQKQVQVSGTMTASGMDFVLYGVCDYVKAGRIFDIKKVFRYEYGKYCTSPQHPMYFYLLPEATRFDYLIFDGTFCYLETYRRCDCNPIEQTIAEFIRWMQDTGNLELYKTHWAMDSKKEELIFV